MAEDNRSKRRLANPSDPSQEADASETSSHSEKLTDVAAILDEIEGIVAHKDPSPSSHSDQLPQQPAQSEQQIPEEMATWEPIAESVEFSIDQLEAELEDAIASELGGAPEPTKNVQQPQPSTAPTSVPTAEPTAIHETVEVPPHNIEQLNWDTPPSQRKPRPFVAALIAPIATPIEKLSNRDRLVVNVAVLSLVLWVPVVWFMALKENAAAMDPVHVVEHQATVPTGH